MKKPMAILLLFLALMTNTDMLAQPTNRDIDSLLCKTWKVSYYEAEGQRHQPSEELQQVRMTFYKDHTVKSLEKGKRRTGTWKYDQGQQMLTITDQDSSQQWMARVAMIDATGCVLHYTMEDNISIIVIAIVPALAE